MGKFFMDMLMLVVIASLVVLVIMNPGGFTQDVTSVGGAIQGESKILTGSGYGKG